MAYLNSYYDTERVAERIRAGQHRATVGGMWDEIGRLQFEYVKNRGLSRTGRFLDVGCGCLRGGLHFINYLDPGRYYGIDLSQALLDAGYNTELAEAGLQDKLPLENLRCTDGFDARPFGVTFEAALALSVFTHLTLNHLQLCLTRLADVTRPGTRFFASVFLCPGESDWTQPLLHSPGGITTFPDQDPFHYRSGQLELGCTDTGWDLSTLEPWNHPRDQWMAVFERTDGNPLTIDG